MNTRKEFCYAHGHVTSVLLTKQGRRMRKTETRACCGKSTLDGTYLKVMKIVVTVQVRNRRDVIAKLLHNLRVEFDTVYLFLCKSSGARIEHWELDDFLDLIHGHAREIRSIR